MCGTMEKFWRAKDGATAIEYAIIAGGIALAIIATVNALDVLGRV